MKEQELQITMVHDYLITWFKEVLNNSFNTKIQRNIVPLLYKLDSTDNVLRFEKEYSEVIKGNVIVIAFSYITSRPQVFLNDKAISSNKKEVIKNGS